MVGFPGESEEDFLDTVDFVKKARFIDAHVFAYSKRKGTPAALYKGQIEESEKKRRSRELINVKNSVRDEELSKIVKSGEPISVILETKTADVFTAHSDSFLEVRVVAPNSSQGDMIDVIPISFENGIITAKSQ